MTLANKLPVYTNEGERKLELVNLQRNPKLLPAKAYSDVLQRFCEKYRFSQTQLAHKIGISTAVLSQVLNGSYKYEPANHSWKLIEKFFSTFEKTVYETTVLKKIFLTLNMAYADNKIAVITSRAGTGKTTAQIQYCLINPDAAFIRVTAIFNMKYLLQKMLDAVGTPHSGMNLQTMMEALYDVTSRRKKIFIVDEAERLSIRQLDLLRDLYDTGNIGLALVGLNNLKRLLISGRSTSENLDRLYSRVLYYDAIDVLDENDVRMIINDQFPGNEVTQDIINDVTKRFKDHGAYRGVIDQLCYLIKKSMELNRKSVLTNKIVGKVMESIIQIR